MWSAGDMVYHVSWRRQEWSGKGYSVPLLSIKNEPVEDQFRLHLLRQVKDQLHPFKRTSRFFCETIGTTYVAKPALYTILILKGSKSTIPWERQTHVNENIGYMWQVWGRKPDSSMTLNTLVTTKNCLNKRRGNRKVQLLSSDPLVLKSKAFLKYSFQSFAFLSNFMCMLQK